MMQSDSPVEVTHGTRWIWVNVAQKETAGDHIPAVEVQMWQNLVSELAACGRIFQMQMMHHDSDSTLDRFVIHSVLNHNLHNHELVNAFVPEFGRVTPEPFCIMFVFDNGQSLTCRALKAAHEDRIAGLST